MIANVMGVKRTTVNSIINKFTKEGRVETKQRGGVKAHKLTEDQKTAIRGWVDDDCSITLPRLKEKCLATFGVAVSPSTIGRVLKAFYYTIKRVHLQPVHRNDAAAIEARWQYAQTFLELFAQVSEAQIYFIDEVGFSVVMRARQGRSLRGTQAVQQVAPGLRTRNISSCF